MCIEQLDFITNSDDSKEQKMNPWSTNNKDVLNKSLNNKEKTKPALSQYEFY